MQLTQAEGKIGNCEYKLASICYLAIEQLIMEIKFCTSIFCLSKEVYLKHFSVHDEEQVEFLDCVVQVQSSWKEIYEFFVCIIPVRKKRN